MPALRRLVYIENMWFQQDGATPLTAKHNNWPPHSPDLNPLDFFLWGYLKDKVYTPKPATLQDLRNRKK